MPDGPWSRKKCTDVKNQKFTPEKCDYAQHFVDFMHGCDPSTVKILDEAGIQEAGAVHRTFGHAPVGQRAIQLVKSSKQPNKTVNLMMG